MSRRSYGEWIEVCLRSLCAFDRRLTFRTSGSSGFIFTLLLPARLPRVEVVDVRRRTAPSLVRDLSEGEGEGDVVIGHPAFWTLLLRHVEALAPGVVGVTSTAPCPADVANGLQAAGLSRLLQIYGSSETGGLGWRSSASEPYRLLPLWDRVERTECSDDSASSAPLRDLGSETQLRRRLPETGQVTDSPRHEFPDRVEWIDGSRFRVLGRVDGAVQVGGINVFLERVRNVLLDHPCVADAAVRPMTTQEGSRLKAFIVPLEGKAPPTSELHVQLTDWITTRLTTPERPRAFDFGTALPRNDVGKLSDWSITRADGKTQMEKRLLGAIKRSRPPTPVSSSN